MFDFNVPDDYSGGGVADVAKAAFPEFTDPGVQWTRPSFAGPTGSGEQSGGAPGGWRGVLNEVGGAAKSALPIAQIGGMIGGGVTSYMAGQEAGKQNDIALRAQKQREQLTNQAAAGAASPLTTFGQTQLDNATKGQVPDAVRAQIDEWKAGALQQVKAYLAHAGLGDSEALLQWTSYIERQAKAMEAQALTGQQQTGISALGAGGGILTNAAGQAGAASQQADANAGGIDSLIASANQQLSRLAAAA